MTDDSPSSPTFMSRRDCLGAIGVAGALPLAVPLTANPADDRQSAWLDDYNPVWTSQSAHALDSMPCGGGDIGLNVWVEKGDILFYLQRSGAFDETNSYLKHGRMRIAFAPDPFVAGARFRQELKLAQGHVEVEGTVGGTPVVVGIWVDVHAPVVHVEATSAVPLTMTATYENWRTKDRPYEGWELDMHRSYIGAPEQPFTWKDETGFDGDAVLSYHRNRNGKSVFEMLVAQQGLDKVKARMWNPLTDLTFGTLVRGADMVPAGTVTGRYASTDFTGWRLRSRAPALRHDLRCYLHIDSPPALAGWRQGLDAIVAADRRKGGAARAETLAWWKQFWERSRIAIRPGEARADDAAWRVGRNYQVFRYQLATNAYGRWPTKFNGGNFTVDPEFLDPNLKRTPDWRAWGGGIFTAQNQRLVYWPMLKSGDFDMMESQFAFYRNALPNAELRTKVYWDHDGASFTEQIENFGLPTGFEYGWNRRYGVEPGVEDNLYVDRVWETQLEFCLMVLETARFAGMDITRNLPLVESCLIFFDQHFQRHLQRTKGRPLNEKGELVFFPSSGLESYKNALNSVVTVSGLRTVIAALLALPPRYLSAAKRTYYEGYLKRIPPIPLRLTGTRTTIAPAELYERIQNVEIPQLYPVFPYQHYGVGLPELQLARDTWQYGVEPGQKAIISWHQDAIFCARLGLTDEARDLTIAKLDDAPGRRMPTFWGPGHDWLPDHNWGGSGMIGLQEMAMQTVGDAIHLFPAWPRDWDVDIRLHAPNRTVVEASLKGGRIVRAETIPPSQKTRLVMPDWAGGPTVDPGLLAPPPAGERG